MSAEQNYSLAESLALLSEQDRAEALSALTEQQATATLYDWRFWARPKQLQPSGSWLLWLVLAGRGFGKTRTGAETVRQWAQTPLAAPIHLVAPTAGDIRRVMIEGPSGILACYPPNARPTYEPSNGHKITWPNGNVAFGFSADEPERLRGPQCSRFWADEIAGWRGIPTKAREAGEESKSRAEETWDNLMFGFRIGEELRGVITTTPKPTKLIKELAHNPQAVVTRGSTYDNRGNLAPSFFDQVVRKYEGTRLGRQELLAEILEDTPGALWTQGMFDAYRVRSQDVRWDLIIRIVVAIDPAVTAREDSDETGIVVVGLTVSGHVLVIDDGSCKDSPLGWARVAVGLYNRYHADRIVGEVNNGGDLVEANIRTVAPNISFRAVHASRGKQVRAEPVAALYEQGRVHHMEQYDMVDGHRVSRFDLMEEQMCSWVPNSGRKSPDRMDALVWGITELLIDPEEQMMRVVHSGAYQISPI